MDNLQIFSCRACGESSELVATPPFPFNNKLLSCSNCRALNLPAIITNDVVFIPVYSWDFSEGLGAWRVNEARLRYELTGESLLLERLDSSATGYIINSTEIKDEFSDFLFIFRSPTEITYSGRIIQSSIETGGQTWTRVDGVRLDSEDWLYLTSSINMPEGGVRTTWVDAGSAEGDTVEFKGIYFGARYSKTKSIIFNQPSFEMYGSSTKKIKATISPVGAYQVLAWRSSDDTIASVSQDGVVTSHNKTGEVTITATSIDGVRATAKVKVYDDNTLYQCPLVNAVSSAEYRTRDIQFGDGYNQRAPDGINTDLREYTLEFKGNVDYITDLDNFFTRHKGVKSFKWQAPDREDVRLYICKDIKQRFITNKMRSLTARVKEVLI